MIARDDSGSMVVALLLSIIASGLIIAVTAAAVSSVRTARHDRQFSDAIHVAERGVEEVLQRLRSGDGVGQTSLTGGDATEGWSYAATFDSGAAEWAIVADGTAGQLARRIEAVVGAPRPFFIAAFSDRETELFGGNTARSYDHTGGLPAGGTGNGGVGSNRSTVLETTTSVDEVHLYGPRASLDCSGSCPSGQVEVQRASEQDLSDTFVAATLAGCTNQGAWQASVSSVVVTTLADLASELGMSEAQLISAGATALPAAVVTPPAVDSYYCVSDITFDIPTYVVRTPDPITAVLRPVVFYATGDVDIDLDDGGNINCLPIVCAPSGLDGATAFALPDAGALRIYSTGSNVRIAPGTHTGAAIYAPNAICERWNFYETTSTAVASWYGSLICSEIVDTAGSVGWVFWYDDNLSTVTRTGWDVTAWREE